jgi:hypothetical protein
MHENTKLLQIQELETDLDQLGCFSFLVSMKLCITAARQSNTFQYCKHGIAVLKGMPEHDILLKLLENKPEEL